MESLFQNTRLNDPAGAVVFLIILAAFIVFVSRARRSHPQLRPIGAFDALKTLLARAAEAGHPVHISVGTAGVGSASTVDTTTGRVTFTARSAPGRGARSIQTTSW